MTTIGSIGIGLFVLIVIWILALIAFVVSVKLQSNFGWIALALATLISVFIIIIPLEKKEQKVEDVISVEKDYSYIYRNVFLSFMILSSAIACIFFFFYQCIDPVRIKPVKSFHVQ